MRKVVVGLLAGVLVLGVAYAVADAADALPGGLPSVLTRDAPLEQPSPFPTVSLDPTPSTPAVLAPLDDAAPLPVAARLAEITAPLLADPRIGAGAGLAVADAATGEVLLDVDAATPRIPASTIKVLTTTAAVAALGEQTRLRTTVVAEPDVATGATAGTPTITLVGGGDVLLAPGQGDAGAVVGHAGLGDLAAQTAAALGDLGVGQVRVALDDRVFTGPTTAPGWGPVDLGGGFVMPVAPLAVDRGIVPGQTVRDPDPALTAARTFASALADAGVAVEGDVVRVAAPEGALDLAAVESATVGDLVTHTLRFSDNDVAEALARLVAVDAGLPADFTNASAAVLDTLRGIGIDVTGVAMADGSGLSEQNAVPPRVLVGLASLVTDSQRPDLLVIANGLPVAGLQGTLEDRFLATQDPASGVLRGKTGTLLTVVALAGLVLDVDGRLLALAVISDGVPTGGVAAARDAVDEWAGRLAACGCS